MKTRFEIHGEAVFDEYMDEQDIREMEICISKDLEIALDMLNPDESHIEVTVQEEDE